MLSPSAAMNELLDLLSKLREQEQEYEAKLTGVRESLAHVNATLELLASHGVVMPTGQSDAPSSGRLYTSSSLPRMEDWKERLKGLTQIQALHRIADESSDLVSVNEAKRIFITTGLAKGKPKFVGPHIYHLLSDPAEWRKEEPGVFRRMKPSPQAALPLLEDRAAAE